jgi:hypothetical protein
MLWCGGHKRLLKRHGSDVAADRSGLKNLTGKNRTASLGPMPAPSPAAKCDSFDSPQGIGKAEFVVRLDMSLGTIEGRIGHIPGKLGADDRTQTAVDAARSGII